MKLWIQAILDFFYLPLHVRPLSPVATYLVSLLLQLEFVV